jgi:phage terminase large subunit-like protein
LLPEPERKVALASLSEAEARSLRHDWEFWARPNQLPPASDWRIWLLDTGRGWGKTRTLCEWLRARVENGIARRITIVGRTAADTRDMVIEGESGLLAISPPWFRPAWEPSKRKVMWPNGAEAHTRGAEEPDALRGLQHDTAVADEIATWPYIESWDNLMLGLRLGDDPRTAAGTTPKPVKLVRDLLKDPVVVVTHGTTYENAINLAPPFRDMILARYEGTRLGRQEIHGELLEEAEHALWTMATLDKNRVTEHPELKRVVVGVDPATGPGETGIVVVGIGADGHGYVLEDATLHGTPAEWAQAVVASFHKHKANRIIAEANNGGDMVEHTIHTVAPNVPVLLVHAARGKVARAEPASALYEQGKCHHVGFFGALESEQVTWEPGVGLPSPNRIDACVWAMFDLFPMEPKPWIVVG